MAGAASLGLDNLGFAPIPTPTNVTQGDTVSISVTITNTDIISGNVVAIYLVNPQPTNATLNPIDPTHATFQWSTTNGVVGQSYPFYAQAVEINAVGQKIRDGNTNFTVIIVSAGGSRPTLTLPFTQTNIAVGATLAFPVYATNTDNTTNSIVFTLDPDGTAATNTSGSFYAVVTNSSTTNGVFQSEFSWTNVPAGNYTMKVTATETSTGASTNQSFKVNVILTNNCPQEETF